MTRLNGTPVHYVPQDGYERAHGECRPAAIVQDWGATREDNTETVAVNLVVFRDGTNDTASGDLAHWETSRLHNRRHEMGTWHFPEECGHA